MEEFMLATTAKGHFEVTLVECPWNDDFMIETIDHDADYRNNCMAYARISNRQQAWSEYDYQKGRI